MFNAYFLLSEPAFPSVQSSSFENVCFVLDVLKLGSDVSNSCVAVILPQHLVGPFHWKVTVYL